MLPKVHPLTRMAAVATMVLILAGLAFVLVVLGEVPEPPTWSEGIGLVLVLPTLGYVAVTGRVPRWIAIFRTERTPGPARARGKR